LDVLAILYAKLMVKLKVDIKLKDNDIQLNYYKKGLSHIETSIHLAIFVDMIMQNTGYLPEIYELYSIARISNPPESIPESQRKIIFEGCSQFIANEYFVGTFHIFESTFRVLPEFYNRELYKKREKASRMSFMTLWSLI
jgi:hypothetical protein